MPAYDGPPLHKDAPGVPKRRKRKQDAPLEKTVTKGIRDYLKGERDVIVYKQHGSEYGEAGTPDFLCGVTCEIAALLREKGGRDGAHGSSQGLHLASDYLLEWGIPRVCVFFAVEVKRPGMASSKPTPEQVRELDRINRVGGVAIVARSTQEVVQAVQLIRAGRLRDVTKGY